MIVQVILEPNSLVVAEAGLESVLSSWQRMGLIVPMGSTDEVRHYRLEAALANTLLSRVSVLLRLV